MTAAWRTWWQGLARRERIALVVGASVVAAALLYAVAVEPAWRERARLLRELPKLHDAAAQVAALKDAALALRAQGLGTASGAALRDAAQQSAARAGLAASIALAADGTLTVSTRGASADAWFAWLEAFARDARLHVVAVKASRTAAGIVDAEARLSAAGR